MPLPASALITHIEETDGDDPPGGVLHVSRMEHLVSVAGGGGVLVLASSTPIEQLGPLLAGLVDVMATSLRWVGS